jgi:hypothetical protein
VILKLETRQLSKTGTDKLVSSAPHTETGDMNDETVAELLFLSQKLMKSRTMSSQT